MPCLRKPVHRIRSPTDLPPLPVLQIVSHQIASRRKHLRRVGEKLTWPVASFGEYEPRHNNSLYYLGGKKLQAPELRVLVRAVVLVRIHLHKYKANVTVLRTSENATECRGAYVCVSKCLIRA